MDQLQLRAAKLDDSEFAFQIKKLAFKKYVDEVWGWDDVQQRALHEGRFAVQDFRVVQVRGCDVGVVAIKKTPECLNVNQIFIHPDHQNKGYGTACMQQMILEANKDALPIQLQVMKVNPSALAFYKRLDFEVVGETETHIQMVYHPIA